MWDARSGALLAERGLPGTGYAAWGTAFDPAGRSLARTVRDGVQLIDSAGGGERLLPHPNAVNVAFDGSGEQLASVGEGGTVKIWSRDGEHVHDLLAHGSRLGRPSFSADGSLLAVGTAEGLVEVWDVRSGTTVALTRQHGDSVNDVLFAPGGNARLVSASDDTTVAQWSCPACVDPDSVIRDATAWVDAN